jgi:hypothetical protein
MFASLSALYYLVTSVSTFERRTLPLHLTKFTSDNTCHQEASKSLHRRARNVCAFFLSGLIQLARGARRRSKQLVKTFKSIHPQEGATFPLRLFFLVTINRLFNNAPTVKTTFYKTIPRFQPRGQLAKGCLWVPLRESEPTLEWG